jgi:hypothetical protein
MATPQQGDALASAKKVLAGANNFQKSVDPQGVLEPKTQPTSEPVKAKARMTPEQHSGSVADQNRQTAAEEGAKVGMHGMPIMHDGGIVKADGPHMLQKGEIVIPASGRQSHYRDVFEQRGRQGLHKYGQSAKEQTRQVGGNTPVKGEEHVKGSKQVKKQVGEPNEKSKE